MSRAEKTLAAFRLARPDKSSIADWARRHVVLPESYALPGPVNFKLTPWWIPVLDALQDPLVRRVHARKAVQTGGTLVADTFVAWAMANQPGPIMFVLQTEDMVQRHCKTRLMPLIEACKPVARMLPRPGPQRTTTEIYLGGSFLICNSANLSNLQSQSIRYLLADEIWLPRWQDVFGHALARVSAFEQIGRSKVYSISQAPLMDAETGSVEDTAFKSGHSAEWSVECPKCNGVHPAAFAIRGDKGEVAGGVVWDKNAKRDDETWDVARVLETVRFRCPLCGHESDDSDATRAAWKKSGRYVAKNLSAPSDFRSFRIEAIVSRPMRLLAEEWVNACNTLHRSGDENPTIEFRTKREARPWIVERKSVNLLVKDSGYKLADHADGQPIPDEAIRFLAIDRQQDHFWAEVGAFSTAQGPRYRQLWFGRIDTRDQLRQLQQRYKVADACVAQDRGYRPADVDRDCAEFGWRSMRGYGRRTWTMRDEASGQMINFPFSDPQVSDYRGGDVYFYNWSGDYFKDLLAAALEGKGDLRWEMPSDVNPLYIEHLKGEHKVEVRTGVWEWREVRSNAPNHGLDTSAMLLCMATIAGVIRYTAPKP